MTEMLGFERDKRIHRKYGNEPQWATVGGKNYYFRSKFERRWAQYLEFLKKTDAILDWEYEPRRFYFEGVKSGKVSYLPDFKVTEQNCRYWHECKGPLEASDVTRFKRMQAQYPDQSIVVVMWAFTKQNANVRSNAAKFVSRVIDGLKVLRQCGL